MKERRPDSAASDRYYMQRALRLARRGVGRVSPNPPVGALAVRDGEVIAEGWHRGFGLPHAEAELIGSGADLSGADVYVTLEPCAHTGKTPPCSDALIASGCRSVTYAGDDPNPRTRGRGPEALRAAGIDVRKGLCADRATRILAPYLHWTETGRPLVTCKWAMSLDGRIATPSGDSKWISSAVTRRRTRRERRGYDAILVGIGTVTEDDPTLLSGGDDGRQPLRVVLDSHLQVNAEHALVETLDRGPVLIATRSDEPIDSGGWSALANLGVQRIELPAGDCGVDLGALLDALGGRGVTSLLVEGGSRVHGSFFDRRLVDRVQVIVGAVVLGGEGALAPVGGRGCDRLADSLRLRDTSVERVGSDLVITGFPEHKTA